MKLYHGTNVYFEQIDLSKSNQYKDFGQAFYLSVGIQVRKFRDGEITKAQFIRKLRYMKGITMQYAFCTPKAIEMLTFKGLLSCK